MRRGYALVTGDVRPHYRIERPSILTLLKATVPSLYLILITLCSCRWSELPDLLDATAATSNGEVRRVFSAISDSPLEEVVVGRHLNSATRFNDVDDDDDDLSALSTTFSSRADLSARRCAASASP